MNKKLTPAEVLQTLDSSMGMKSGDWLEGQLQNNADLILLDLRTFESWKKSHIPGSKQVLIQDLPSKVDQLIVNTESTVVCICNGSVQSAMAVLFLRTEGYKNTFNLSGGFSSWSKNSKPLSS